MTVRPSDLFPILKNFDAGRLAERARHVTPDDSYIHTGDVEIGERIRYASGQLILSYLPAAPVDRYGFYPITHTEDTHTGMILCQTIAGQRSIIWTMPATYLRWCILGDVPKAVF